MEKSKPIHPEYRVLQPGNFLFSDFAIPVFLKKKAWKSGDYVMNFLDSFLTV
jgi:hypothetical protein